MRPRRRSTLITYTAFAIGLLAYPGRSCAQESPRWTLVWTAPPGITQHTEALARMELALRDARSVCATISVEIRRDTRRACVADLTVATPGVETVRQTFRGHCSAVVDDVITEVIWEIQGGSFDGSATTSPTPERNVQPVPPAAEPGWQVSLGAGIRVDSAVVPGGGLALASQLALDRGQLRILLAVGGFVAHRGEYALPVRASLEAGGGFGAVSVAWVARRGPWHLGALLGIELGVLTLSRRTDSEFYPWIALPLGLLAGVRLAGPLVLWLNVSVAPLPFRSEVLESVGPSAGQVLFLPPAISARAEFVAEVRF